MLWRTIKNFISPKGGESLQFHERSKYITHHVLNLQFGRIYSPNPPRVAHGKTAFESWKSCAKWKQIAFSKNLDFNFDFWSTTNDISFVQSVVHNKSMDKKFKNVPIRLIVFCEMLRVKIRVYFTNSNCPRKKQLICFSKQKRNY